MAAAARGRGAGGIGVAWLCDTTVNIPNRNAAVTGRATGTGGGACQFAISNASNTASALLAVSQGSGTAFFARNSGTGQAARISVDQLSNPSTALRVESNSNQGSAAYFTSTSQNSLTPTIRIDGNNHGAILAESSGAPGSVADILDEARGGTRCVSTGSS